MSFASVGCMTGFSTRRNFCLLLATALACSSRVARAAGVPHADPRRARIGVLGSAGYGTLPGADDARAGLALGIEEAGRTAAMFGLTVDFVIVLFSDDASHRTGRARHARADSAARSLVESGAVALVAAAGPADAAAIASVATSLRIPYVDLLSPAPGPSDGSVGSELSGAPDDRWALYVAPPRALRMAASDSSAQRDAWRHDLVRYGAAQLNDRYRARFGTSAQMSGHAWAGWFAAKALVEACLRAPAMTPVAVRDTLLTLRFDGHKGEPLHFSPDGVLQQPLYSPDGPA